MNRTLFLIALVIVIQPLNHAAVINDTPFGARATYNLQSFSSTPLTSGSDILVPLTAAFDAIRSAGQPATLNIPAGSYFCPSIATAGPCTAPDNCEVVAAGVTVTYPSSLAGAPNYPSVVFCQGTDVQGFTWEGGSFVGFNYDTATATNSGWAPQETVCTFDFSSSVLGCNNIAFDHLSGLNSGCMVRVSGINFSSGEVRQFFSYATYSYSGTKTVCDGVSLTNCNFANCGLVLWDYGYLWQIITYQSHYSAALVAMAEQYMNQTAWVTDTTVPTSVTISFSGSKVLFDNSKGIIPASATGNASTNGAYLVSFGPGSAGTLPSNITPGLQYYVVNSAADSIEIASSYNGAPIVFSGVSMAGCDMFYNLTSAYWDMYLPTGANLQFDGAWHLTDCSNVQVQSCTWSAPGDSEVMEACQNSSISGGSITDAKMGALFFGGCLNTVVNGLQCNGGDGSRIVSVEYGDTNTTIENCAFTGGGRGTIINYALGLVLSHNTFTLNNGKTASNSGPTLPNPLGDFATNRISFSTGNWEQDPTFLLENNRNSTASSNIVFTYNTIVVQPTGIAVVQMTTDVVGWEFENNSIQGTMVTSEGPFPSVIQPAPQTILAGSTIILSVSENGRATFQWYLNGVAVPDATNATLVISGASAANAGNYTCAVTNSQISVTTEPIAVAVVASSDPGRLINLSCRAQVGTGPNALIAGFAVGGFGALGTERVLIRASGPALIPLGVSNVLLDPLLELHSSNGTIDTDNGWGGASGLQALFTQVGAFAWSDPASLDSALAETLVPGTYSAVISGENGETGVALAEVYDATSGVASLESPRLINLSARVQVGTGSNILIAGFVIGGTTSKTVLIRASGPALAPFGVTGALPDPEIELHDSTGTIATNTGWKGDPQIAATAERVGAFSWGNSATPDSALLVTLAPGSYTAEVFGASGDSGIALVEVYDAQ